MINIFHIVSDKTWGGPEQYAYDLILRLKNHTDEFYVETVCNKSWAITNRFRSLEVPISTLPLRGVTDLDSPVRFARLLKRGQNVVHVHSFRDAFTAVMAKHISENKRVKIVLSVHGMTRPRLNYLTRRVYREVDRFIFGSQKAFDFYMAKADKIARDKSVVIRESVHHNRENCDDDLRVQLNVKPNETLVMFHGRLCPEKGIDVALKALSQLDKSAYKMAVIGEGAYKFEAKLKGFIVANQLVQNVTFLGFIPNVLPLLDQCDVGVIPSVVPEAMGMSVLEYMMQGKPVITTNNGAQPEYIVNGKNGILVDPDDPFALADAIKKMIENPDLRHKIGAQAKEDFEHHLNYDHFYSEITSLYHQLFE